MSQNLKLENFVHTNVITNTSPQTGGLRGKKDIAKNAKIRLNAWLDMGVVDLVTESCQTSKKETRTVVKSGAENIANGQRLKKE